MKKYEYKGIKIIKPEKYEVKKEHISRLELHLLEEVENTKENIVLDLGAVTLLTTAPINSFIRTYNKLKKKIIV